MIRNYLTVALRNLVKHRLYSAINIVGLAVGLAASILIGLFVRNELNHDSFFSHADRTYQVAMYAGLPGREPEYTSSTMLPFAEAFRQGFPEVEATARILRQRSILQQGDAQFFELAMLADPTFLRLFDFPFLAGDRETALDDPSGIVLTRSMAQKYFGRDTPLGETLTLDNQHTVRVTGVMEDLPANTHFEFGILLPYGSVAARNLRGLETNWGALCCLTYVRFKEGTDVAAVEARLPEWIKATAPTFNTPQGAIVLGELFKPELRPLREIHLRPALGDMRLGTSPTEIVTFSAIAALVLAIASINFMNLATARATQRAREVSVRKVVGASRTQIVVQFIGESVLLTGLALLLALALVELMLPVYSGFLGKPLSFDYADPVLLAMVVGAVVVVGILGGSYPAFFLSSFNPAKVLKGASSGTSGGSGRLRLALVVVQFAISIGLMVATAVVYGQLLYAQNKDLGFDKDNLLVLGGVGRRDIRDNQAAFMEALRQQPGIVNVAGTNVVPGDGDEANTSVRMSGAPSDQMIVMRSDQVSVEFAATMGLRVVAGRDFDRNRGADRVTRPDWQIQGNPTPASVDPEQGGTPITLEGATLINQGAVKRLGLPSAEAAIGQVFEASDGPGSTQRLTIVGVVEDFHFRGVQEPIAPAFFTVDNGYNSEVMVRVAGGQVSTALESIDRTWREFFPNVPVQREFLDSRIQELYQRERTMSALFAAFAGLAIVIACLGLFGLASFTAERRTKEIGLRKVLGARTRDIVRLLVWQFSKPVLIANLIAWPVAAFGMHRWLSGFTYRIDLNPLLFLGAGLVALAIAWATVGLHAARVAQAKPVRALRYE